MAFLSLAGNTALLDTAVQNAKTCTIGSKTAAAASKAGAVGKAGIVGKAGTAGKAGTVGKSAIGGGAAGLAGSKGFVSSSLSTLGTTMLNMSIPFFAGIAIGAVSYSIYRYATNETEDIMDEKKSSDSEDILEQQA